MLEVILPQKMRELSGSRIFLRLGQTNQNLGCSVTPLRDSKEIWYKSKLHRATSFHSRLQQINQLDI